MEAPSATPSTASDAAAALRAGRSSRGSVDAGDRLARRVGQARCVVVRDEPDDEVDRRRSRVRAAAAGRRRAPRPRPAMAGGQETTRRPPRAAMKSWSSPTSRANRSMAREPLDQRQRERRLAGARRPGDQDAAIAEHQRGGVDVGLRQASVSLRPAASPRSVRRGLRRAWCRGCSRPSACRHAPRRSAG